jgi:hypothetical protein
MHNAELAEDATAVRAGAFAESMQISQSPARCVASANIIANISSRYGGRADCRQDRTSIRRCDVT